MRLGRYQIADWLRQPDLQRDAAWQRHVVQGRYEHAIPAASYALRFGTSIYGEGRVELVPALLMLAEANLGLLYYGEAESYLTKANWVLLKTDRKSVV